MLILASGSVYFGVIRDSPYTRSTFKHRHGIYVSRIHVNNADERVRSDFIPSDEGRSYGRLWRFVRRNGRNGW